MDIPADQEHRWSKGSLSLTPLVLVDPARHAGALLFDLHPLAQLHHDPLGRLHRVLVGGGRGEEGVVGVGRGLAGEAAAQQQGAAAGRRAVRGHHLGGLFGAQSGGIKRLKTRIEELYILSRISEYCSS